VDSFLTILVLITLSALSSWLNKKFNKDRGEDGAMPTNPPPRQPTMGNRPPPIVIRGKRVDWEQELRRILMEEKPHAPAPVLPRPQNEPPPVRSPMTPPLATVLIEPPPAQAAESASGSIQLAREHMASGTSSITSATRRISSFDESIRALRAQVAERARKIIERAERMEVGAALQTQILTHQAGAAGAKPKLVLPSFYSPENVRLAVIAAVVLAPPKSLENEIPLFEV